MKSYTIFFVLGLMCYIGLNPVSCHEKAQTYCGRRLATAMFLVCDENFQKTYNMIKRSDIEFNAVDSEWPLINPYEDSIGRGKRNREGGIIEECCLKPCTINTLLRYCG